MTQHGRRPDMLLPLPTDPPRVEGEVAPLLPLANEAAAQREAQESTRPLPPTPAAWQAPDAFTPQDTAWSLSDWAAALPISSKIMGVAILALLMVVVSLMNRPSPTPVQAASAAPVTEAAQTPPTVGTPVATPTSAPAPTPAPTPPTPQQVAQDFLQTYTDGGGSAVTEKYGATLDKDSLDNMPTYLRNPEAMNVDFGDGNEETYVKGIVDVLTKGGDWATTQYIMTIEHYKITSFLVAQPGTDLDQ